MKLSKKIGKLRWKAYWYSRHNDSLHDKDNNTYFCFPTRNSAPECEDLNYLEHDLYLLVRCIKFRKCKSHFQKKLSSDIKRIKSSNELIISSDKTDNLLSISKTSYNKLMKKSLTNNYKIASNDCLEQTILKAAAITIKNWALKIK